MLAASEASAFGGAKREAVRASAAALADLARYGLPDQHVPADGAAASCVSSRCSSAHAA
jgi:hypothetical protein